jgi:hypothetical protein
MRVRKSWVLLMPALASSMVLGAAGQVAASNVIHPTVVSETAVTWTPHLAMGADGVRPVAYSITQAGDTMVVGGKFIAVQNSNRMTTLARSNIMAFSATTGAIASFAPTFDDQIWSVLGDGNSVYVGGEFKTVNGTPRAALAKLDLTTGQLDPTFQPKFSGGRVTDMALVHGQLIVAGTFQKKLASLNPTTGKATSYINVDVNTPLPFTNRAEVFRFDVSPDGQHLVAVGNFQRVGTQTNWRVFMMDLTPTGSSVSRWQYEPSNRPCHAQHIPFYQMYVRDVDFAPDSSWFALASTGGFFQAEADRFRTLCDTVVRFETNNLNPLVPTWMNKTGGDSLHSVLVTGAAVYVQGHSRWLDNPYGQDFAGPGAVDRMGGGAVNPVTGVALPWNPRMPQQKGGYQMLATPAGVWFATDGTYFNGKYHLGIRFAPLP